VIETVLTAIPDPGLATAQDWGATGVSSHPVRTLPDRDQDGNIEARVVFHEARFWVVSIIWSGILGIA